MMGGSIRTLVVEDQDILRKALAAFLAYSDDIDVIGAVRSGEEAVAFCGQRPPDVVLMDIALPVMNGLEATRRIRADNPSVQVIMYTNRFVVEETEVTARLAGASRFLFETHSVTELAEIIRDVVARDYAAISSEQEI
jgi:DNA-binding NarL/FixJ family response regulator